MARERGERLEIVCGLIPHLGFKSLTLRQTGFSRIREAGFSLQKKTRVAFVTGWLIERSGQTQSLPIGERKGMYQLDKTCKKCMFKRR